MDAFKTYQDLAGQIGVNVATVARWCKRFGVKKIAPTKRTIRIRETAWLALLEKIETSDANFSTVRRLKPGRKNGWRKPVGNGRLATGNARTRSTRARSTRRNGDDGGNSRPNRKTSKTP